MTWQQISFSFGRLLATVLAALLSGGVCAQGVTPADRYPVNFDRDAARTRMDRVLTAVILNGQTITTGDPQRMYYDLTSQQFAVRPGQRVSPHFLYSASWMQGYVYADWNGNGRFDVTMPGPQGQLEADNELLCFAAMGLEGGNYDSAGQQHANLNVVQPPAFTIPEDVAPGRYVMRWKVDWNSCDAGGRMDDANPIIANGGAIVDVTLCVMPRDSEGYEGYDLVFADEFDQPDGSAPDASRWRVPARRGSTWNRWISSSDEVAFVKNGALVCRAVPNADRAADDVAMLTGAVETQGLFAFTYGRVEVRLRTKPFAGNFPAAWMMPQPPCATWPNAGEIDIFEAIDARNTSYHTIHSHWSYDLGHRTDPVSSFTRDVKVAQWHVYGLEWVEDLLVFTVDGEVAGTYARSSDAGVLGQGQWPFDHPFYLILNQSVGDGSWARAADTSHTYETYFDYVRVYQRREGDDDGLGAVRDGRDGRGEGAWYDLSGRRVAPSQVRKGFFINNGRKYVIR